MSSSERQTNSLEPWADLKDKVVMVTGASSGIGRDLCLDLAKAGCKILAAARRIDRLNSLCDQINATSALDQPIAVAIQLDVAANGPAIEASVDKAWNAFGRIDALINNAGIRGGWLFVFLSFLFYSFIAFLLLAFLISISLGV